MLLFLFSALTKAPADWLTTISYYNNLQGAYIRFWFVLAPSKFGFLEYNVRLEQILAMENTTQEHRAITEENIISKVTTCIYLFFYLLVPLELLY